MALYNYSVIAFSKTQSKEVTYVLRNLCLQESVVFVLLFAAAIIPEVFTALIPQVSIVIFFSACYAL